MLPPVLDAAESYAAAQDAPETCYIWLSCLCIDHHRCEPLPMLWWQSTFRAGLKAAAAVRKK